MPDAEALASALAARGENLAAPFGFHSLAETVRALAL
jgi:hypothetical protein